MSADGLEQRTADLEERFAQDLAEIEISEMLADDPRPFAFTDKERIEELKMLLADISVGAELMLEPIMEIDRTFKAFAIEVKRIADTGKSI